MGWKKKNKSNCAERIASIMDALRVALRTTAHYPVMKRTHSTGRTYDPGYTSILRTYRVFQKEGRLHRKKQKTKNCLSNVAGQLQQQLTAP